MLVLSLKELKEIGLEYTSHNSIYIAIYLLLIHNIKKEDMIEKK